jgi:hypothetical protein
MRMTSAVNAVLIAAAILAAAGCATLPSPDAMKAEIANYQLPKLPEPGKALVYVVRPSGMGGLVRFNVFLGDQEPQSEMGYTRASQYIHFNIPPGNHKIYSKAENWAELLIAAREGDIVFVQQNVAMGVVMARNNLHTLEDYQGKYHVKNLTPGTILKQDK